MKEVFLTYATHARGLDTLPGTNHYLDLTPEGRNGSAWPDWPRRHDEYPSGAGGLRKRFVSAMYRQARRAPNSLIFAVKFAVMVRAAGLEPAQG
ncbi:MAG TPA: DUF899 family protein [Rhizomicrobium sp.]|nr:DUF899 family protein [Rhizomicrobium sp.]